LIACHRNLICKKIIDMIERLNISNDMDPMKMTLCREMIGGMAIKTLGASC
jgi:hypothetical protein